MIEKRRRFQDMQANPDRYEDAQIEAMEREIDSKPDVSSEWRKFASEHGLSHHERKIWYRSSTFMRAAAACLAVLVLPGLLYAAAVSLGVIPDVVFSHHDNVITFMDEDYEVETTRFEDIVLDRDSLDLNINEIAHLNLSNYHSAASWISLDSRIAEVLPDGTVTGKGEGKTQIEVHFLDSLRVCRVSVAGYLDENAAVNSAETENLVNGHQFVDLGLSVKWATMNVGAEAIDDYGDYFAWGELHPKSVYTHQNYSVNQNPGRLRLSLDAANYNWGGTWRIPTEREWSELRNGCTWKHTAVNGVEGYLAISLNNGNSIFFPSAGLCDPRLGCEGSWGMYWSSNRHKESQRAWCTVMHEDGISNSGGHYRKIGMSVRAVCE